MTPEASSPPLARRVPKELTTHGHTRIDDYFWLRDRSDPAVIAYLEAENAYTAATMQPTEALQNQLYDEILGRIKEDDVSAPVKHGDYFYYSRTEKGKAYSIHCRKHLSLDAPEEITLDANVLAQGHSYFRIGASTVSPDHTLLAYSVDLAGDETFTLRVKDLRTGTLLPDEIANTYYSVEWANDNRTLFYTVLDEAKRPYRVYRHELGATDDALVYEEADARFEVELQKTRSRAFIFIMIDSPLTSEVRAFRADDPRGDLRMVQARQPGVEFDVEHQGEWFYIRTNEGAQNFRVVRTPAANPSPDHQEEIVPGSDRRTVEDVNAFRDYLVLSERENGLETLRVTRADDRWQWQPIPFQEPVYSVGVVANPEYDTNQVRFTYTSLVMPTSVYDYNMETAERVLVKRAGGAGRLRSRPVCLRASARPRRGRRGNSHLIGLPQGPTAGSAADAALRLRRLRADHRPGFRLRTLEPARPRLHLRHRPYPRQRRHGQVLARRRQTAEQAQHLHRLHRLRGIPDRRRHHRQRSPRHPGWQRRRPADGRGGEPAPRSLPRRGDAACPSSTW